MPARREEETGPSHKPEGFFNLPSFGGNSFPEKFLWSCTTGLGGLLRVGDNSDCAAPKYFKSFVSINEAEKRKRGIHRVSAWRKRNMSEHEEKLKQEPRLLVQRTGDVHLARVGGQQLAHHTDSAGKEIVYSEAVQASGVYLPESEARRLAANGSVMIVKDIHGQETVKEQE